MNIKEIAPRIKFFLPLVLLAIIAYFLLMGKYETTNNAYVEANISIISSEISGKIKEIKFKENEFVKKDQVLVVIDDEVCKAKLETAEANYKTSLEELEKSLINIHQAEQNIIKAKAELSASEADVVKFSAQYRRGKSLAENNITSKQKFENSVADFAKSQNSVESNQITLNNEKDNLKLRNIDNVLAKIKVNKFLSELKIAERDFVNATVRAPFDGFVVHKMTEENNFVGLGSPLFYMIPKEVFVMANFKENQIANIKVGQKVLIKLDAFPKRKLKGKVENISYISGSLTSLLPPENATGNFTKVVQRYPVKIKIIEFAGLEDLIKPGFSAEVKIGINSN